MAAKNAFMAAKNGFLAAKNEFIWLLRLNLYGC